MEETELKDILIDGCDRAKSIEIRRHEYVDGDEVKVEYVAIGRLKTGGFSRKTADDLETAVRKCVADID